MPGAKSEDRALQSDPKVETGVMPLWPDAAKRLGLGRSAIYDAAKRDEVPGLMRFGKRFVVAKAALARALGEIT